MNIYRYTDADFIEKTLFAQRRITLNTQNQQNVRTILEDIAERGEQAYYDYAKKFDQVDLSQLLIDKNLLTKAESVVDNSTKKALQAAQYNVADFARSSMRQDWQKINQQGVEVGEKFTPIPRVGVYIPGGKAPLVSTVMMTAGIAHAVGVPSIIAATPCDQNGEIHPAILYALQLCGVQQVIPLGGIQGIAALVYGTQQTPSVDKIFGPGNRYVVEAKRQLFGRVNIDLLPGPSEVLILADDTANPSYIAADMLAQMEHGNDSIAGLITPSSDLITAVQAAIQQQLQTLSRQSYLANSIQHSFAIEVASLSEGIQLVNDYAPEHLSVSTACDNDIVAAITNAGAIYQGSLSAVAVGDFLAGPSHTLPTGGSAKYFSGITADQFQKRTSIVKMSQQAIDASVEFTNTFAQAEGLDAHGKSVSIRSSKPHDN